MYTTNTVYNLYYRILNIILIVKVVIVKMLVVVYLLNTNFEIMLLARGPTARFKKIKSTNFEKSRYFFIKNGVGFKTNFCSSIMGL